VEERERGGASGDRDGDQGEDTDGGTKGCARIRIEEEQREKE
jgi:hypothetical protein